MKEKNSIEIFFNLGGDGTLGNDNPVFTFPAWQYNSTPLTIEITRDTIIVTG